MASPRFWGYLVLGCESCALSMCFGNGKETSRSTVKKLILFMSALSNYRMLSTLRTKARLVPALGFLFITLLISQSLLAQTTFTYTGGSASWTTATWVKTGTATAATYPGEIAGENHIASATVAGTLTLNANITNSSLRQVTVNTGVLDLGANSLTINAGPGTLSGTGTATIAGGSTLTVPGAFSLAGLSVSSGTPTINFGGNISAGAAFNLTGSRAQILGNSAIAGNAIFGRLQIAAAAAVSTPNHITTTGSFINNGTLTQGAGDTLYIAGDTIGGTGTSFLTHLQFLGANAKRMGQNINLKGDYIQGGSGAVVAYAGRTTVNNGTSSTVKVSFGGSGQLGFFNVTVGNTANSKLVLNRSVFIYGTANGTNADGSDAALGIGNATGVQFDAGTQSVVFAGIGGSLVNNNFNYIGIGTTLFSATNFVLANPTRFGNLQIGSGVTFAPAVKVRVQGSFNALSGSYRSEERRVGKEC